MGWNDFGSSKPSSTENFSGENSSEQTTAAYQTGSFNGGPPWAGINPNASTFPDAEMLQGVPAQVRVSVTGDGVTQVSGAINQLACQVSLASGTLQLTGHVHDAENNLTDPALAPFVWVSRNSMVATVNSSGLVTLVGRGQVTAECQYPRAANAPFVNATPSGSECAYATVDITVLA
jgi:hypothetical protein